MATSRVATSRKASAELKQEHYCFHVLKSYLENKYIQLVTRFFFFLNCVDWINSVAKLGHCALLNVRRFQTPLTSITTLLVVWLLQHGANASAARNM